MTAYAVIDFETTGFMPSTGDRPMEIAVVIVENENIVDRYQSLMNPRRRIPYNVQTLTGITDTMVQSAPSIASVMAETVDFIGTYPIVAHNANFDKKFWDYSVASLGVDSSNQFICTWMLAKRVFPHIPNHRLETLVRSLRLPTSGSYHRALADAECTAHLLLRLKKEIALSYELVNVDSALLMALQKKSKTQIPKFMTHYKDQLA